MDLKVWTARILTLPIPVKSWRKKARENIRYFFEFVQQSEKYIYGNKTKSLCQECQKLDKSKYQIVSLGSNCFPRMFATRFQLKSRKAEGELSMPFDLAKYYGNSVVEIVRNDFSDFFDDFVFDKQRGYWYNPKYNIECIHDDINDAGAFRQRYEKRIENFYKILSSDKFCLFMFFIIFDDLKTENINELYELLKLKRGNKPFKLLIINWKKDIKNYNPEIAYQHGGLPFEGYDVMDFDILDTKTGYELLEPVILQAKKLLQGQ